jgi:hypothetical protein
LGIISKERDTLTNQSQRLSNLRSLLNRLGQTVLRLSVVLFLGLFGFYQIWLIANPQHINHLALINLSGRSHAAPFTMHLNGEVKWTQTLTGGIGEDFNNLVVFNISHAFFSGTVTLVDANNMKLAQCDIRPHGRYCGTLVITLLPNGESKHSFNRLSEGLLLQELNDVTP